MKHEVSQGILVVGHGSRRQEANKDVFKVTQGIKERGGFELVETAFLEIAQPNIRTGFARLVEQGAHSITVYPYFLSPGRHIRGDLPIEVSEAAAQFPDVSYQITEPLAAHPLVIEASLARIRETQDGTSVQRSSSPARPGTVYLVGAGPGDPGLLTLRALDLLKSCDVVIYDYLVSQEVLDYANPLAEQVYVGKIGGGRQTPQAEISRTLIERAQQNERVVRLKGGDPLMFGRGGEEAEALYEAGIPFEIIPGISSALAVPAYAGIPLTHRSVSSSLAIITGTSVGGEHVDPATLAALSKADTIVILMGMSHLPEIAENLMDTGCSSETPVAVIRWGTYTSQQTVVGTLSTIADDVKRAGISAPAVIVIGEVVTLRERLQWFEPKAFGYLETEAPMALATVF